MSRRMLFILDSKEAGEGDEVYTEGTQASLNRQPLA